MESQSQNHVNMASIDPFQMKHSPDITSWPISHPSSTFCFTQLIKNFFGVREKPKSHYYSFIQLHWLQMASDWSLEYMFSRNTFKSRRIALSHFYTTHENI